jgi:methionyl-tRNA formyltransferase
VRVAFFGSGSPLSAIVLNRLAMHHEVVAVVIPDQRLGRRDRLRRMFGRPPDNALTRAARELGRVVLTFIREAPEKLSRELAAKRPELTAIGSFPERVPHEVLTAAERGGVNLHQSLLPRGRGPDPIFWSYYHDERETGSTVHWLDDAFDHGGIISQLPTPIARGRASTELYFDLADLGAQQLVAAIDAIARGDASSTPQDEALATYDGSPLKVPWRVPFDSWNSERTWHFLAGIGAMMGSLCRDPSGQPLPMGPATSYSLEAHQRPPGSYETTKEGLRLYCPDGVVDVTRWPARR